MKQQRLSCLAHWMDRTAQETDRNPPDTVSVVSLGGFNVSNLMGIKRRIIDIGKKIAFYFLQNV